MLNWGRSELGDGASTAVAAQQLSVKETRRNAGELQRFRR